jgi:hypothetical protein
MNRLGEAARQSIASKSHVPRGREHRVDLTALFQINQVCFRVRPLDRRVLVFAVDGAVNMAAVLEILNKIRGEEALPHSAFVVDDKVDLFGHRKCFDSELRGSAKRGPRMRGRSAAASVCGPRSGGDAGPAVVCPLVKFATAARRRVASFGARCHGGSPFTSARNRAIVSVSTATPTVASSSRISLNEEPFYGSSTCPL